MTEPTTQAAHSGTCPSDCSACRVCGEPTPVVFNIGMKATPICEGCANAITLQQVQDLVKQNAPGEGRGIPRTLDPIVGGSDG